MKQSSISQPSIKHRLGELKEECEEKTKLCKELQQKKQELQDERDSLAAQLEITLTKADSEQLARSIAEEQYSDLEKEDHERAGDQRDDGSTQTGTHRKRCYYCVS